MPFSPLNTSFRIRPPQKPNVTLRRIWLYFFCALFYLLGVGYHALSWAMQESPAWGVTLLYNIMVLSCYGLVWVLVSQIIQHRRHASPARVLWTTLFIGTLLIGFTYLVTRIGGVTGLATSVEGFDYETGVPLTAATVLKMNLLSLFEMIFVIVLLQRFKDLVLFKRTKGSQRNWYLMLGLIVVAALSAFMKPLDADDSVIQAIAVVPAFAFMVVNSFRLSWIVQLSFREKVATIGLLTLLLGLLIASLALGESSILPGTSTLLTAYSYPLSIFNKLAIVFGILYCTTSLLSLLFHLPTTGDFQRKADEMAAMHSLTNLVNQVFNSEKLISTIVASPVEAGSAHAAWLAIPDADTGSLHPRIVGTHNISPTVITELIDTRALYQEVLNTRRMLLLDEAPADHRIKARPGDGISSLVVFPLIARDELLGALFVSREVMHGFEKDDIEAIGVFAAQAALALDNAHLFAEQIEKQRLASELSIAREVQHKLLPQTLPRIAGTTLAASSVSALEVGGDYYDFTRIDKDRLAFIVADVSGKGTSAAFYMAELQGIFHAVSPLTPHPHDFLLHANRALSRTLEKNTFISVIYGLLDLKTEVLHLARAGHCPAAFIDLHGNARLLRPQGMGLGLHRGELFEKTLAVERLRLQPGDVFVLYTDGVVESRNRVGEEYGYDRLLKAMAAHRHEEAPALHDALLADLNLFLGENKQYDDDLTLVVVKWHGITLPGMAVTAANTVVEAEASNPSYP